jgi:hypothetical protein
MASVMLTGICFSVTAMPREKTVEESLGQEKRRISVTEEPWWGPGGEGNQVQQLPPSFPEFHQNNQLSYPLIYSYLASTEEQVSRV